MNRKILIPLTALVALGFASPVAASPPPPSATMSATCEAVTFSVSGYPDGSMVSLWGDSGMPYQFVVGEPASWYTSEPGGGSGSLPMTGLPTEWDWAIDVRYPDGQYWRPVSGHIACPDTGGVVAEPVVEVETFTAAPAIDYAIWTHVALAPPW